MCRPDQNTVTCKLHTTKLQKSVYLHSMLGCKDSILSGSGGLNFILNKQYMKKLKCYDGFMQTDREEATNLLFEKSPPFPQLDLGCSCSCSGPSFLMIEKNGCGDVVHRDGYISHTITSVAFEQQLAA
jgi:hypothetical protein